MPPIRAMSRSRFLHYCQNPQESERWAMYRLICPLIDRVLARTGSDAVFEYKILGLHNKTIKPDICLLFDSAVCWLIDAKAYAQNISPYDVEKYCHKSDLLAVTNGRSWLFVLNKANYFIPIFTPTGLSFRGMTTVMRVLSTRNATSAEACLLKYKSDATAITSHAVKPAVLYQDRGERVSNAEHVFGSIRAAVEHALRVGLRGAVLAYFTSWNGHLSTETGDLTYKVRASKFTAWRGGRRVFRIMLDTTDCSILVPASDANQVCDTSAPCQISGHHNTPGWKEVKISDLEAARQMAIRVAAWLR